MKKTFIVFICDAHHSHKSKEIIAVCDDFFIAYNLACEHAKESSDGPLSEDDKSYLRNIKQTQNRFENYLILEFKTNKLS